MVARMIHILIQKITVLGVEFTTYTKEITKLN